MDGQVRFARVAVCGKVCEITKHQEGFSNRALIANNASRIVMFQMEEQLMEHGYRI